MKAICIVAALAATSFSLIGCGSDSAPSKAPAKHTTANINGDPNQTWSTPYKETTCGDWTNTMGTNEKYVAADDLLISARTASNVDGVPSESMIESFQKAIDSSCQPDDDLNLVEIAASVYTISGN